MSQFVKTLPFSDLKHKIIEQRNQSVLYNEITTIIDQKAELERLFYFKKLASTSDPVIFQVRQKDVQAPVLNEEEECQKMVSVIMTDIYGLLNEETVSKAIQARLYIMRAFIFARSKQFLKAIQDLCCARTVDQNLVQVDWVKQLLVQLDESEMDFVVKMDEWIKKIVNELDDRKVEKVKKYLNNNAALAPQDDWVLIGKSDKQSDVCIT